MTAHPTLSHRVLARPGARPGADRGDQGVTLIEVVTAMAIMSVLMALVTAGIVHMYRFANRHEAISNATSQLNLALLHLDREIRYAEGISTPGSVGPDPYVEYLVENDSGSTCVELRLQVAERQIQRRTWPYGPAVVGQTPWRALASNVASTRPFTVAPANATYAFQRLELRLTASAGSGATKESAEATRSFTALNSSPDIPTPTLCTEGRAIP